MKWQIIVLVLVVSMGVIFAATDLGSGGFLSSFLGAFGLITIFIVVALVMYASKVRKRNDD
ncbi:MAG: hypothetical protein Alis3KO_39540 [Aliiglaciecola sp.]|uniref:hypothetical protein n=1 Tax=Aliiglaciecola sp. M165 TaxID=2593649 RepID=UPI00117E98EE|nr:hypothetical protein [Aliiglaciecola sp. M165]TRY32927.1 hypothetical protein FM019_02755 [Aliiglaciecola sp. M165]